MSTLIPSEVLRRKRDGKELSDEEISFFVKGIANGSMPDYQSAAFLMASFIRGLSVRETVTLTRTMKESGRFLEWRKLSRNFEKAIFADKHSTGGVGDKVSLILAPLAVCLGLKVPMMSGRGLGHTGGTVDKLQSIDGFNMYPDQDLMVRCLDEIGTCMMAQAPDLCPADRKLYALRDVTGTIESVPLITASIVSKKWAEGVDAVVYDVKVGSGAFMETIEQARVLGASLVKTSQGAGMKAQATLTRMEEPLGSKIGNALEVIESLEILSCKYESPENERIVKPLADLCCELVADMAVLAGTRKTLEAAKQECSEHLRSGRALEVFLKMAATQGAKPGWQDRLARAPQTFVVEASRSGVLSSIHSRNLGIAGILLKVGRASVEDVLDPAAGFEVLVAQGDRITKGQPLCRVHVQSAADFEKVRQMVIDNFVISDSGAVPTSLVLERIQ